MDTVPALRISQKGVTLYVTALPLRVVAKYANVDRWTPDNREGYQRPLVDRRLAELARYVVQEEGVLPTSVLLCARSEDTPAVRFEPTRSEDGFADLGTLEIPEGATLWVVDGQNRLYGVLRAYERGDDALGNYTFPVSILYGVERYDEMIHFNIINTRQRKMPTDIVDRHLLIRMQNEGLRMISAGRHGEREYLRGKTTHVVDILNETSGPWQGQIAIPGVAGREQGLVRQHAMVYSLEPVMKDPWVATRSDDEVVKLLVNFWQALRDTMPEAFESPAEHRIQATVGIYSLHMVLPSVIQICLAERDLSPSKMREIMEATGITSTFWHKDNGDPLILGTGMASMRALAQYIRDQLPRPPAPAI